MRWNSPLNLRRAQRDAGTSVRCDWSYVAAISGLTLVVLSCSDVVARAPGRAPLPIPKVVVPGTPAAGAPDIEVSATSKLDVEQARERLMEQLLRAAEAGIVDLKPAGIQASGGETTNDTSSIPSRKPDMRDMPDGQILDVAAAELEEPTASKPIGRAGDADTGASPVRPDPSKAESHSGSHFNFPQERDGPAVTEELAQADAPNVDATEKSKRPSARCFTREQLRLPDVQPGDGFARSIGESRKALVGEFDATDTTTGLELAKIYIAVGMVEEARSVLSEYLPGHALSPFLLGVSDALSGGLSEVPGALSKEECIGAQALWRAFAQSRAGQQEAALRSEISSGAALEELPLLPRQIVAAEIGLTAADRGEWETVRRMEAMARRSANGFGETLGATHLLSYRLATWRDDFSSSEQHLSKALVSDPDTAVEALLIRARQALRSDDVLNQSHAGLRLDLGELARSELGSDVGRQAFELEARLFNRQATVEETIAFLSDAVDFGLLPAEDHPAFLAELISTPAYNETSRPLALIYLEEPSRFEMALKQDSLRRALIRSLAGEGLPGMAQDLLQAGDLDDPALAVELADGYLVAGDARAAIATISKSPNGIPQRLVLTEAFIDLGDYEKAIRSLDEAQTIGPVSDVQATEIDALKLQAELGGEEFGAAYQTAIRSLESSPDAKKATQTALIALEAGADDLPQSVRDAFDGEQAGELDALERLYALGSTGIPDRLESPDDLTAILQSMEDGERATREMLEDG